MSYFQHDTDAINDPKITALISEHGGLAYGIFWRIVELLHDEENHKLQKKNYIYSALAQQMSTNAEQIKSIIKSAIECEIFYEDEEFIWSKRVFRNIEKRNDISIKRSEAGKISALKRTNAEQVSTNAEQMSTIKEKEIKEKEIKEKESKKDKKELPTSDEVRSLFVGYLAILNITDIDEDKLNAQIRLFTRYYIGDEDQKGKWVLAKKNYNAKSCVKNWVDKNINAYKSFKKIETEPEPQYNNWRDALYAECDKNPKLIPARIENYVNWKDQSGMYDGWSPEKMIKHVQNLAKNPEYHEKYEKKTAQTPSCIDSFCANFGT